MQELEYKDTTETIGDLVRKQMATQKDDSMSYYNSLSQQVFSKIEKYVVITTGANYKGSWAKESGAIGFIKDQIKRGCEDRYLVLEAKKEIGTKSPEIEIEEIK